MSPEICPNMLNNVLYEKRFGLYIAKSIITGFNENKKPVLDTMDLIGVILKTKDFVVAGMAEGNMYGMCETLWKLDIDEEELFELIVQTLSASVDRDV